MNWLITYRTKEGTVKKVPAHAVKMPNHKAMVEKVLMDAYNNQPPVPMGDLSSAEWLDHCKVEILDIDVLPAARLQQASSPVMR